MLAHAVMIRYYRPNRARPTYNVLSSGRCSLDSFVTYELQKTGYALVTICREPVNSMNLELWQQLARTLETLEADPKVRGLIFQSGLQRDVFTAGNDINELYAPKSSAERYREFWVTQNQFFARLYRSRLATVAAIRGACPAGGCALALCCDYRVMTDFGQIGLNEVALGIPVPAYWALLMARTVGQRQAEQLLPYGLMPSAADALKIGLVDALVPAAELRTAAEAAMDRMLTVYDSGRAATKQHLRAEFSRQWEQYCITEAEGGWKLLSHPSTVAALESVLQRLSKGKKEA